MNGNPYIENSPETQPFWEAAAAGRFVLPWCGYCGKTHWFPRGVCPHCLSTKIDWKESRGVGEIHSFSVNRLGKEPSVLAYVALEEGPLMLTNVVDADPDTLSIGMKVKVTFRPAEGEAPVPRFRLC
jgi:uncharacterized OB-fold protein